MTTEVLDGSIQHMERQLRAEMEAVTRQLEEACAAAQQQAIEIVRLVALVERLKLQRDEANNARRVADDELDEWRSVTLGCSRCPLVMAVRKAPVR